MTPLELQPSEPNDQTVVAFNRCLTTLPESAKTYESPEDKPVNQEIEGPRVRAISATPQTKEYCEQLERDLLALSDVLSAAGVPKDVTINNSAFFIKGREIYNAATSIEEKAYLLKSIKNWWILLIKAFSFVYKDVGVENRNQAKESLLALSLRPTTNSTIALDEALNGFLPDLLGKWQDTATALARRVSPGVSANWDSSSPVEFLDRLDFFRAKMKDLVPLAQPEITELKRRFLALNTRLKYVVDDDVQALMRESDVSIETIERLQSVISAIEEQETVSLKIAELKTKFLALNAQLKYVVDQEALELMNASDVSAETIERLQIVISAIEGREKMSMLGKKMDYSEEDILKWEQQWNEIKEWSKRAEYFCNASSVLQMGADIAEKGREKGFDKQPIDKCLLRGRRPLTWKDREDGFKETLTMIDAWEKPGTPEPESKTAPSSDMVIVRPKREPLGAININDTSTLEDCTKELKRLCERVPYLEKDTNKIFASQYPNTVPLEKAIKRKQQSKIEKQLEISVKQKALETNQGNGEISRALQELQRELQEIELGLERCQTNLSNTRNQQIPVRREQIRAVAEEIYYLERAEERGLLQQDIDKTLQTGRGIGYPERRADFFKEKLAAEESPA